MRIVSLLLWLAVLASAGDVQIGVLSLFHPERIVIKPASRSGALVRAGNREVLLLWGQTAGIRAVAGEIDLFAQRTSSTAHLVQISARDGGPVDLLLAVPSKIERRFRGSFEFKAHGGSITASVAMDVETAVAAAVAAEMRPDAGAEALKAMAVLARSFYRSQGRRHAAYDFCDTTHCQFHREPASAEHPATAAAEATRDIILSYRDAAFAPMYSSSCGGRTRTAESVGLRSDPYPYFEVDCAACIRSAPRWQRRLPSSDLIDLLEQRTETARLAAVRRLGWSAIPSLNFEPRPDGDFIVLTGRGEGHGVGVCQHGATALAAEGLDYRAILARYLPYTSLQGLSE